MGVNAADILHDRYFGGGTAGILAAKETVRSDFLRGFFGEERQNSVAVRTNNLLREVCCVG